jgi:hypothetical protein
MSFFENFEIFEYSMESGKAAVAVKSVQRGVQLLVNTSNYICFLSFYSVLKTYEGSAHNPSADRWYFAFACTAIWYLGFSLLMMMYRSKISDGEFLDQMLVSNW